MLVSAGSTIAAEETTRSARGGASLEARKIVAAHFGGDEISRIFRLHGPGALEGVDVAGQPDGLVAADIGVDLGDPPGTAVAPGL